MKKIVLIAGALLLAVTAGAKVRMPGFFSDNMVLQQNSQAKIWGWTDAGKSVSVTPSWNNKAVTAKADKDGRWSLSVDTPAGAIGKTYTITVSDGQAHTINNVLIGEVWICSGQSNMQIVLRTIHTSGTDYTLKPIMTAGNWRDRVRVVTIPVPETKNNVVPAPIDDPKCEWMESTPQNATNFSCTAFFFARYLSDALQVPVGIVASAWGGSRIEAWMNEETLKTVPDSDIEAVKNPKVGRNRVLANGYNGMINAIKGYTARGFLWYQGESSRHSFKTYDQLMQAMVALWRKDWGDTNNKMPFYYVQIAPYAYPGEGAKATSVPVLVEAQIKALKLIPNSGIVGTTDVGDEFQIHPMKKEPVGFRLFNLAMVDTYGIKYMLATGPILKSFKLEDDKGYVTFDNAPFGLMPEMQNIQGMEVAGDDQVFYPADKIQVDKKNRTTLIVSSSKVAKVASVRYAYYSYPEGANLCNTFGLPAFPFRTDTWEVKGKILD